MKYSSHTKFAETSGHDGKIYILKRNHGDVVTIGETSKTATGRLKDYSKKHGLIGFRVHKVYKVPMEARKEIERIAFRKLKKYQIQDLAGAKEVFDCGVFRAEQAIESAIKESKIAIYAKKKADAQAKYNAALEERKQAAKDKFHNSNLFKTKKRHLENFIENTVFEKKGKRNSSDISDVFLGMLAGIGLVWLGVSFPSFFIILIFGSLGLLGSTFKLFDLLKTPPDVPNQEALDKKKQMEDGISAAENNAVREAEAEFRKKHKLEDFFGSELSRQALSTSREIMPA